MMLFKNTVVRFACFFLLGFVPTVAARDLPGARLTGGGHTVRRGLSSTNFTLTSGHLTFSAVSKNGHYRICLHSSDGGSYSQPEPVSIMVVGANGETQWLTGGYDSVTPSDHGLSFVGTLATAHGTVFHVVDTYHASGNADAVVMMRTVGIASPSPADKGFNSQVSLEPDIAAKLTDEDCFVPGIWYGQNEHVPPRALAGRLHDRYYFFREDRLPLPLVTVRDRRTGTTLLLAHLGGTPTTFAGETGQARVIDARMQFGALGLVNTRRPSPAYLFPGTEGERTYIGGASTQGNRWAYRSHPVSVGVRHSYRLLIGLSHTPNFPAAVRQTWRTVYAFAKPPVIPVDLGKIYRDSMSLLSHSCQPYLGRPDVPFAVKVPSGIVADTSSEMGFVGQALPVAALLLRDGLETDNPEEVARASDVVDFWARNAPATNGAAQACLPRTWYDVHPDGSVTWRSDQGYLRIASDGMEGALHAWSVMRSHGQDRPTWLAFCKRYGDWLVAVQDPDGSYARRYSFSGMAVDTSKDATDQAIPFLVDLYKATGDARYRDAALSAGRFCWKTVHLSYAYVGGTPDNPNVTDKEGGMEALAAFLALYDVTRDALWLKAAAQAADYCETWIYCWNVPIPPDDSTAQYPAFRTTFGLSLIATGHSGCDNYMAAAPFLFYRLSLLIGARHHRRVAQMLLHDTKQMLDWDGRLGYASPGLLTEVLSLSGHRGHGASVWLPWLSVAVLEPMVDLRQTYGAWDIDQIERLPRAERLERTAAYSRTRGLFAPSIPR